MTHHHVNIKGNDSTRYAMTQPTSNYARPWLITTNSSSHQSNYV